MDGHWNAGRIWMLTEAIRKLYWRSERRKACVAVTRHLGEYGPQTTREIAGALQLGRRRV